MKIMCDLCPKHCVLNDGQVGFCLGRKNDGNQIIAENYGRVTSIALDPIEKKPLYMFFPRNMVLSIGSYGCNLKCPFCQNHTISQIGSKNIESMYVSPEELIKKAIELIPRGNIGIAYTYNEPLIGYEYILDCSKLAKQYHLKNILVTNGTITKKYLENLLPYIDAMNIDLKGFTEDFYKTLCGDLKTVMNTIELSYKKTHIELTKLIIPTMNDDIEDMENMCEWIKSLSENIPLHISRFFPRYKMQNYEPTPIKLIYELSNIAKKYLKNVFVGNC
ncbi:MAG: AmmeMemoRadiSam system radical SAM enzyme [Fusobacteriaceae bacterium]|jgi:pyruvate formate lyase activating enzyme|nr:AmmeMemoRadiSam system radical SAM enzyme [Fusobacteriaceae bacterium]